jgi:hypothetical protein
MRDSRRGGFVIPHDGNGNVTALPHLPALDWDTPIADRATLDSGSVPDRASLPI